MKKLIKTLLPLYLTRFEQEAQFLKDRWGETLLKDPYYNPNLTLQDDYYQLAFPPRSKS
jgi:hypothetical protein